MKEGFTLIEILVTLSIGTILIAGGIWITVDAYQSSLFDKELNLFVQVLEKARSEAVNNIDEKDRSVLTQSSEFIIFSGDTYDPNDSSNETIMRNGNIKIEGDSKVVFEKLRGDSLNAAEFTFSDGIRTKAITVDQNGRINY